MATWYYEITATFTTKREAWITGDLLSYRGPYAGKYRLTKLGPRQWAMAAVVEAEFLHSGEVKSLIGPTPFGQRTMINN